MARKRKIRKGALITSLDQLAKCEWTIIRGKPQHRGWVQSWQLRMAAGYINSGTAYEGVRLTNGEYYDKLTDKQINEKLGTELCLHCSWLDMPYTTVAPCEGRYCAEAIERWKDEVVE
jgi:hypothetical protein